MQRRLLIFVSYEITAARHSDRFIVEGIVANFSVVIVKYLIVAIIMKHTITGYIEVQVIDSIKIIIFENNTKLKHTMRGY